MSLFSIRRFSSVARWSVVPVLVLVAMSGAHAKSSFLADWNTLYPTSQSALNAAGAGSSCLLCHSSTATWDFNGYGYDIYKFYQAGASRVLAIQQAGPKDSDQDPTGATSDAEIKADTQPGYTSGPNNTYYTKGGSATKGQMPPSGILGQLDPPAPSPWTDLGKGLAGTTGTPVLQGSGTLQGGAPMSLSLTNALPGSSAWLIVGYAQADLPFYGGTLVPFPNVVIPGLPINGAGSLVLGTNWPAGIPSGFSFYFHYWVVDPAGPQGASASNALKAVTP